LEQLNNFPVPVRWRRVCCVEYNEFIMTKDDDKGCGPKWGWARKGGRSGGPFGGGKGFGGPPWMRGGPFGAKSGRMFGPGDLRLLLLALIADKPSHGYDLIRTIEARFGGSYAPSPGAIYPTLTLLEEQELIESEAAGGAKKSYAATLTGRQFLAANSDQVKDLMARIDIMAGGKESEPAPYNVLHAVMNLRHSVMSKPGGWTDPESERVRAILEKAARDVMDTKLK
jgi:DNA-binding PadR family transcriptional regulator